MVNGFEIDFRSETDQVVPYADTTTDARVPDSGVKHKIVIRPLHTTSDLDRSIEYAEWYIKLATDTGELAVSEAITT
jgi:hypothetical protein